MKRITGTHVYTHLKCPRAVALDLHEDRSQRRDYREDEEFVLARGRDHEAVIVAELGWAEPEYPAREFAAGAEATLAMMREGVPGLAQGILMDADRLGIPDLLRREDGKSDLGDYHYVIGDIKSSGKPRSDQILQVVFYSVMLAEVQGRAPEYGYLILKDGQEYRFSIAAFRPAFDEVITRVGELRADRDLERPFLQLACESCHWSEVCLPQLETADDLSLLQGMTRGVRTALEVAGQKSCASLSEMVVERVARKTHLEPALLRRLKRAAESRGNGTPLLERRSSRREKPAIGLHFLMDAFLERVLFMGALEFATGKFDYRCPSSAEEEWSAFSEIIDAFPRRAELLHYGMAIPEWYEENAHGRIRSVGVESRFVDFGRQLRGAAVYPGPIFGLGGHVKRGLGLDPHREGRSSAAAFYGSNADSEWLRNKGRSDLEDIRRLKTALLDTEVVV